MVQDLSQGVLISGSSLVLQEVRRDQAGDYTCYASNLEGDTTSDIINIQIRCEQWNQLLTVHLTIYCWNSKWFQILPPGRRTIQWCPSSQLLKF